MIRELIKRGFLYYLWIQASILLVTFVFMGPIHILIGFFSKGNLRNVISAIIGIVLELAVCMVFFFKYKYDDKRINLNEFLKPAFFAFPIHFLVSLANGFYAYTAGWGVSEFGSLWGQVIIGENVIDKRKLPLWPNIIVFLIMLTLILGAMVLAYKMAEIKHDKNRRSIIEDKRD